MSKRSLAAKLGVILGAASLTTQMSESEKRIVEFDYHEEYTRVHIANSPIFYPKKHTVESYRSQQRKAKKR